MSSNRAAPAAPDSEKLLYKLVIQFLIFSQGSHKLLDPHLLQIGKRLRNGANLSELSPELQAISKTLTHISKHSSTSQQAKEESEAGQQSDYVLQRIDELINSTALPARLQQNQTQLKQRLKVKHDGDSYKKVIDSAINLLLNIKDYAVSEQNDIDVFLTDLSTQLGEIEQQAETVGESTQLAIDSRDSLNATINRRVYDIKDSTEAAEELSVLKNATGQHLDNLLLQLVEHQQQEDQRQHQAQQQIQLMTRKLQVLETETETLRTKLKIEHDRALSDALTGLPNRLAYKERVELELNRWKRYQSPLALAIWDIDHFKAINDSYGHKAGDKTLALVGQLLLNNCRETDFVARYGGEEFVMLMPNTSASQALEMAENIRLMIQNCGFNSNGEAVNLTISCGISEFVDNDQHDDAFVRADQALYQAKQAGRNHCTVFGAA